MMKSTRMVLAAGMAMSFALAAGAQTTQPSKPATPVTPKAPAKPDVKAPEVKTPAAQPVDPSKMTAEDMMKAWEAANPVTAEHARLVQDFVGEWTTTAECWMTPGSECTKTTGTATFTSIPGLKGRFVAQAFSGEMLGKPFKGQGWFGFNTTTNKYESVWIDSSTNGIMFETGTKDGSNAIDWRGTMPDPFTKEMKPTHSRTTFQDANTIVFEMFDKAENGTEFRNFRLTYTRAGAKTIPGAGGVKQIDPAAK